MASISGVLQDNDGNDLYPYTFDQEVLDANNVPISQRLGSASEASAVAGTSAFAKINTLSSDLTSLITETFTCTSGTPSLLAISYNKATLRRYGKIGIVEIEAWSQAEIAVGATINITITGLKIAAGTNGCSYSGYGIIGYGVSSTNNGNDVLISARYFASNIPASYQEMFRFAVLLA